MFTFKKNQHEFGKMVIHYFGLLFNEKVSLWSLKYIGKIITDTDIEKVANKADYQLIISVLLCSVGI